jgi:aspartate aminotransferase-like enzyme
MFKKNYLLAPGPTPVPPESLLRMAEPVIHHRTPQYRAIFKNVTKKLKTAFQTKEDVYILASSGTGAMEASLCNFLSTGDEVIVGVSGKWGERFQKIAEAYGVKAHILTQDWGKAIEPSRLEAVLKENPGVKAVYTTLCETSTGVVSDIESFGKIVASTNAILVVDAIAGLGADVFKADEWKVDVVVAGSQKGLMLPPGLGFISVSPKAWKLNKTATLPRFYFDLAAYKKAMDKEDTPYTSATTLIAGLGESLSLMEEEGMEEVWERHRILSTATQAAIKALGLELFAESPSRALTSVKTPAGLESSKMLTMLRDDLGVTFADGQAEMKGKIFRIAHLGYMNEYDLLAGIAALERAMDHLKFKVSLGVGVSAFQTTFLKEKGDRL